MFFSKSSSVQNGLVGSSCLSHGQSSFHWKKIGFFFSLLALLGLTSCGGDQPNNIVSDVSIKAELEGEEDVKIGVSAIFNLGNMSMTSVNFPIVNPNDPEKVYGRIMFMPTIDGRNQIGFEVNLSQAADVSGGRAKLPNGSDLPIGGLENVDVLELNIDQINAKIYLALNNHAVMVGFAIAIEQFDTVGDHLGNANIFPGFNIKGVRGIVGLFTSTESNKSGLAFFVDLSSVVTPEMINDIINKRPVDAQRLSALSLPQLRVNSAAESELSFETYQTSEEQAKKAGKLLNKMSKGRKEQLRFVEQP